MCHLDILVCYSLDISVSVTVFSVYLFKCLDTTNVNTMQLSVTTEETCACVYDLPAR